MTSATYELRRLLDERGVEWEDMSALGFLATLWHGEDAACTALEGADDIPHGKVSVQACLTPEQAVEATLGRGTCRIDVFDNLAESDGNGDVWLECSACHWQMDYAEAPSMPLNYCPNCGRIVVE